MFSQNTRVLETLSLQIVSSYFVTVNDVINFCLVCKRVQRACVTSKYPSLVPYFPNFPLVYPHICSVSITSQSINSFGKMIWQHCLNNIGCVDLSIDDNTPDEALLLQPSTINLIHYLTIKSTKRYSNNTYLLIQQLPFLINLRRLELPTSLLFQADNYNFRSEEQIADLLLSSSIRILVLREFDIILHESLKSVCGKWRGQAICYLLEDVDADVVQRNITNTPRNMLYFLTSATITDADVRLLSTQIVLYKNVLNGITMAQQTKELAQWRSIFQSYAITTFGIKNCTAEQGHKVFFKAPLIKEVILEGQLIQRPWFFQQLESVKLYETLAVEKSAIRSWSYDIFDKLKRMELTCGLYTICGIKLPQSLEWLRVTLIHNSVLENHWDLSYTNLKDISLENLMKNNSLLLPTSLESINFVNIFDNLYDLYKLNTYAKTTKISLHHCNDVTRYILPTSVVELEINSCDQLKEVYRGETLTQMTSLSINNCMKLKSFMFPLSLQSIELKYCDSITQLPNARLLSNLTNLDLSLGLSELILPSSIQQLSLSLSSSLTSLTTSHLTNLKVMFVYANTTKITLASSLTKLNITNLPPIDSLNFLPEAHLSHLTMMNVSVKRGVILPTTLKSLTIQSCTIPNLFSLKTCHLMTTLSIERCNSLSALTLPSSIYSISLKTIPLLSSIAYSPNCQLLSIYLEECLSLELLQIPFCLESLCCLHLYKLNTFVNLDISKLTFLTIVSCGSINVLSLPTSLQSLSVESCGNLNVLPNIHELNYLESLKVVHCQLLQQFSLPYSVRIFESLNTNCGVLEY
ncbi:Leucine-rich repeat containing protein [Entamoeba marina]